ncbi:MAG TPA: non-canonical purine NTP pyrophosphatase [Dehalococcoidia bacterium]|nr:non-canonical purine NTP pyrophosphatase [Dehalococcoidia bacterium]
MNNRILLATGNPAKQETLRWLVEGLPLTAVTPRQLGLDSVPDESGATHQEIARQKAEEWSRASSMLVIASDGGLVIPALGANWESRFTHRFAGPAADDHERLRRLLEIMQPYSGSDRAASWIEAVAIAEQGKVLASWELTGGTGIIATESPDQPGGPGFWVFSVWYFPQFGKTYNQLSGAEKESLDDHWIRLKDLVQGFFKNRATG